jgi:hypothetical protein
MLQDKLMKKKDRKPASEAELMLAEKKAKRDAVVNMRDKGMEDIIRSLSKTAVAAEKSGDEKTVKRLMDKIDKLKRQAKQEKDSSDL